MDVSIFHFPTDVGSTDLILKYLKQRKEVFIDLLNWELDNFNGVEFDYYDLDSYHLIGHKDGNVLGGARLVRTNRRFGSGRSKSTYMINDAYRGFLDNIPSEICSSAPPIDENIWEVTRLASFGGKNVTITLMDEVNAFLKSKNGKSCLFLGPAAFMRIAKSMGFNPQPLGKIASNKDGKFVAFSCAVK